MAPRSRDPSPSEIAEQCRQFRLNWSAEEREEALSFAPAASVTDEADRIYLEHLAFGEHLSFAECLGVLNDRSLHVALTPRVEPWRGGEVNELTL